MVTLDFAVFLINILFRLNEANVIRIMNYDKYYRKDSQ